MPFDCEKHQQNFTHKELERGKYSMVCVKCEDAKQADFLSLIGWTPLRKEPTND